MSLINLRGRVAYVFNEDNFDTDLIVGIGNIRLKDADEMARVAMNAYDKSFALSTRPGDLLVGGANFGYGHPHYPPMIAMRRLGIAGVIAESFSPGYWLGEIAEGFPQISCPGVVDFVDRWDEIEVDWQQMRIINHTRHCALPFEPLNRSAMLLLESGGLIPYLKRSNR
ncbi:3-isopropylmalate dehydratase, small subunit [Burkholderia sp. D7]|nr:3-isopropylmalate dehydratase, small subunit [Burkholderia sp. D7]